MRRERRLRPVREVAGAAKSADASRGFVLLVVLWSLGLLALAGATALSRGRSDALIGANIRASAAAGAAADAALATAIFARLGGDPRPAEARVTVRDEAGRINPNIASVPLLRTLLATVGVNPTRAEALASAIVDWRSPGQGRLPHGAKAAEYREAGLPYGPPRAPFQTLGELGDVLGMTSDALAAVLPHLTLWWEDDPDVSLADGAVAQAMLDAGLGRPPPPGGTAGPRILTITATAARAGAERTRHATVRFGFSSDGKGFRIFDWADGPG